MNKTFPSHKSFISAKPSRKGRRNDQQRWRCSCRFRGDGKAFLETRGESRMWGEIHQCRGRGEKWSALLKWHHDWISQGAESLFPTKYVHPAIKSVLMRNSCRVRHQSQANLLACIEIAGWKGDLKSPVIVTGLYIRAEWNGKALLSDTALQNWY